MRAAVNKVLVTRSSSGVVIVNGLAILFMIDYVLLGIATMRTVTLPRTYGVLVAVGAPAYLLAFGFAAPPHQP